MLFYVYEKATLKLWHLPQICNSWRSSGCWSLTFLEEKSGKLWTDTSRKSVPKHSQPPKLVGSVSKSFQHLSPVAAFHLGRLLQWPYLFLPNLFQHCLWISLTDSLIRNQIWNLKPILILNNVAQAFGIFINRRGAYKRVQYGLDFFIKKTDNVLCLMNIYDKTKQMFHCTIKQKVPTPSFV